MTRAAPVQSQPRVPGPISASRGNAKPEVALKLCRTFNIEDTDRVQRLAYAGRAPEWLRESIVAYEKSPDTPASLSPPTWR